MKSFLRKKRNRFLIMGILFALSAGGILVHANNKQVGVWVWQNTHRASLATLVYPDAEFFVEIGNYYFNETEKGAYNIPKAKKYFEKAITQDKNIPDAWHQLARIAFLEGDYPKALFYINNQLYYRGRELMSAYYMRGLIYGYAGKYKEAQENFIIFLSWDNKNWAAHNDLAWAYFQEGKYAEAYATAYRGLLFSPKNPWLLNMAGVALLNSGKKKEAQPLFEKALDNIKTYTPEAWGKAYPGNDPRIAEKGLAETIRAIEKNLAKSKS